MNWFGTLVGLIMLLVGLVWIGQGINLVPGSFMTGQPAYAVLGLGVAGLGVVLLYAMLRPKRRRQG